MSLCGTGDTLSHTLLVVVYEDGNLGVREVANRINRD